MNYIEVNTIFNIGQETSDPMNNLTNKSQKVMTQEQQKTWVDLSKSGRLYSTRSDIPGIQNKNSNKGWYGVILCKDEKKTNRK